MVVLDVAVRRVGGAPVGALALAGFTLARVGWVFVLAGCAFAMTGCVDDGERYLRDASFRRARLEASLVNPANRYSRLRLDRYATGASGGWDELPAWNPAVES